MSASHGRLPACATGRADRSPPLPVEDRARIRCTAEELCAHSVCAGCERSPTPMRRRWGAARRGALCARCSRLVSQVSLRASRHARTHEHLLHHTAWTACSPHVLAGRRLAAGRQWSSHTMDFYGCTSGGQLDLVLVHAAVQWFASVCSMCRPITNARSTSHSGQRVT